MAKRRNTEAEKKMLLAEISDLGRKFSDVTIQFHHQVAESVGLSGADHKYLNVLLEHGEMTAGQMAELTDLTTGAITGVLDRLEKQGLVSREKDPTDRRKVIVKPNHGVSMQKLGPVFQSLSDKLLALNEKYSPAEREVIRSYMKETIQVMEGMVGELKKIGSQRRTE